MGICSTEASFLVRMTDKMSRLSTFIESGQLLVKGDGVEDTLIDIINYAVLFRAYVLEQAVEEARQEVEPPTEMDTMSFIGVSKVHPNSPYHPDCDCESCCKARAEQHTVPTAKVRMAPPFPQVP